MNRFLVAGLLAGIHAAGFAAEDGSISWTPENMPWQNGPAVQGIKTVPLWGEMDQGAYGALVRLPAGRSRPAHAHTSDLRAVVVSGAYSCGAAGGKKKSLGPGSYFLIPAGAAYNDGCAAGSDCVLLQLQDGRFDDHPAAPSSRDSGKVVAMPLKKMPWAKIRDSNGMQAASLWGAMDQGAYGSLIRMPGGTNHPWHTHSNDLSTLVISGTVFYAPEGGAEKRLGPGSYVMTPGRIVHGSGCVAGSDCLLLNVQGARLDYLPAAPGNPDGQAALPEKKPVAPAAPKSDVDEPAKTGDARPDDFALVIGIEEYQSLPRADFGARDARTVRRHLEALGVPARNIVVLENQAATGNKMKSYLEEWLPLNVNESSTLFVYYSGHGAPDPGSGQAYLVPWDGDPQFLKSTAYPLKKLYSDLAKTKAKRVIVALDACFSGAGGRSVLAKGARPLVTKVDQGAAPDGRITILAAASGDQITGSLDEQGHGMFTYFLLKGLAVGKKTAKTLFDYLSPRVRDEARRQNREQTPALLGADAPL